LSIENIPLDEIEEAFEGETEGKEGCSSMTTPAPPNAKDHAQRGLLRLVEVGGSRESLTKNRNAIFV